MDQVTQTSLEALLLRATHANNSSLDQPAVEAFCTLVTKERDGAYLGVKVIAAKLPNRMDKEMLLTLNLLDTCMSKCGTPFQNEVGKFRFLNELIKLVSPKYLGKHTAVAVKQKVLQLLFMWTLDYPHETKIVDAFNMLRRQGVVKKLPNPNAPIEAFNCDGTQRPAVKINNFLKSDDEEKSQLLQALAQSKDPEDIQLANWLIKSMVKEQELLHDIRSRTVSELESVQNNLKLLNEMLNSYKQDSTTVSELDLMRELYENCKKFRTSFTVLTWRGDENLSADLIMSVILANEELCHTITKYNSIMANESFITTEPCTDNNFYSLSEMRQYNMSFKNMPGNSDYEIDDVNPQNFNHGELNSSMSSTDELCDIFASTGHNETQALSDILQPTAASGTTESSKETERTNAFEDLDVLSEHLLKENIPSSKPRPQEKTPMNSLATSSDTQNLNFNPPGNNLSSKLESLSASYFNFLIAENPPDPPQPSRNLLENDHNSSTDDCLVDISENNSDNQTTNTNDGFLSKNYSTSTTSNYSTGTANGYNTTAAGSYTSNSYIASTPGNYSNSTAGNCSNSAVGNYSTSTAGTSKLAEKKNESTNIKLNDISITLKDIKPSHVKPIVVLEDRSGVTTSIHPAKDQVRPGVYVYVVTTVNKNELPICSYLFQAVVPKKCKLRLLPPSCTDLPAFNPFLPPSAVTQIMLVANPEKVPMSLKCVLSFVLDEENYTEMGEIEELPLTE